MQIAKYLGLISSLSLGLASVAPARAQDLSSDKVLAGREMPLSISAKQLTSEYRRMVVNAPASILSLQTMMIDAKTGVETGLYFSKGETVTAGDETYLIAYRPQFQVDMAQVLNHGHGNDNDGPVQKRKLRPNMMLSMSLLNMRTNARLDDIRAFDPKRDMESPQESSEASLHNLRGLGQGMMTYLNGRGRGAMPQIGTTVTPTLKRTFYPFVHDQNLWIQLATEELYQPNPRVSNINVNRVADRKYLIAFYETTPGSDGLRGVLFMDGHVERVTQQRWTQLRNVKVIPRPGVKSVYASTSTGNTPVTSDGTTVTVVNTIVEDDE